MQFGNPRPQLTITATGDEIETTSAKIEAQICNYVSKMLYNSVIEHDVAATKNGLSGQQSSKNTCDLSVDEQVINMFIVF